MGMARATLLCCIGTRRRAQAFHDDEEAKKSFLSTTCPCCAAPFHHKTPAIAKMATPRRWLRRMNRVFARSPPCGLTAVADETSVVEPRRAETSGTGVEQEEVDLVDDHAFSREHVAAATIQACFRGHLARRAFRALKSLVKLQAFARGLYVRKQADVAIQCMQVLVRLQVGVRARQLLNMSKEE